MSDKPTAEQSLNTICNFLFNNAPTVEAQRKEILAHRENILSALPKPTTESIQVP